MNYYYKLGEHCEVTYILIQDGNAVPNGFNLSDIPLDNWVWYYHEGKLIRAEDQPTPRHIFNYELRQWIDPRTIDQAKDAQWATIKAAREAAITSPLVTPYGTFDATANAQRSITDAVLMLPILEAMGAPQTIEFTLHDNSTATLTTAQMVQIGLALGAQTQAAHAKARLLRAQIEAATTAAEVEGVVWN